VALSDEACSGRGNPRNNNPFASSDIPSGRITFRTLLTVKKVRMYEVNEAQQRHDRRKFKSPEGAWFCMFQPIEITNSPPVLQ
jgi:hypothetical protein